MIKSTITVKFQTTIPKEIRETLRVGPRDVLLWEVVKGHVLVTAPGRAFLKRRGAIQVGGGSTVEDVRTARSLRGRKA